jgi:hypothetical protein
VSAGRETERLCWRCRVRRVLNTIRYRCLSWLEKALGSGFWNVHAAKPRLQDRRDNGDW